VFIYGVIYALDPTDHFAYLRAHLAKPYYLWGLAAATSFILIIVLSIRWIRINRHELFICSHVVFSIIFFVSCIYHWYAISLFSHVIRPLRPLIDSSSRYRQPRSIFPLSAALIFLASRLHRLIMHASNHLILPYLSPPSRSLDTLAALARLPLPASAHRRGSLFGHGFDPLLSDEKHFPMGSYEARLEVLDERCLRVVIEVPDKLRWEAGQFVFISFNKKSAGRTEWHPFSISNLPIPLPNATNTTSAEEDDEPETSLLLPPRASFISVRPSTDPSTNSTSTTTVASSSQSRTSPSTPPSESPLPPNRIIIILTPQDGLTRRLYKLALQHTTSTLIRRNSRIAPLLRLPALVEGPYGTVFRAKARVETLILVGGGTGMAYVRAVWEKVIRERGWGGKSGGEGASKQRWKGKGKGRGRESEVFDDQGGMIRKKLVVVWVVREERKYTIFLIVSSRSLAPLRN
jgi:hypothetical protein